MARTTTVGSPSLMRQLNLDSVLRVIRTQGPLPRPELARVTGLSMPTVKQLVDLLLAKGYVEEVDPPTDVNLPNGLAHVRVSSASGRPWAMFSRLTREPATRSRSRRISRVSSSPPHASSVRNPQTAARY